MSGEEKKNNISRRDFIKTGILALGAGAVMLSGCSNNDDSKKEEPILTKNEDAINIVPKKTGLYEFSMPLPFDFKMIDQIAEINSKIKKSKIINMYNNTPMPLADRFNQWIQVNRGTNENIKTYNDFKKYVKHAFDNGFEFTYLLNSPKPFSEKDYLTFKDDFLYLIDFLKKANIKNLKVGNTQVASLLYEIAPNDFNLHASTVFEYHNISQYNNLFNNYPDFKLIDIAQDENQNFKFLQSLRKKHPKIKLEIMVNEICIKGCPARISHCSEASFCSFQCPQIVKSYGRMNFLLKTGIIYPWNLEYYSAIGVNNFKFASKAIVGGRSKFHNIQGIKSYLMCVENGINDFTTKDLSDMLNLFPIGKNVAKLTQVAHKFPDIRHFVKHGHECSVRCNVDCFYCDGCAKKLDEVLLYS